MMNIIKFSDSKNNHQRDIGNLDDNTLQMIIYEIYARHGHEFIVQKNMDYFKTKVNAIQSLLEYPIVITPFSLSTVVSRTSHLLSHTR